MHNLLHLVEDVIANGPLWCNSLFVFEDWNGDITNFFHGTQNIPNQVMILNAHAVTMFNSTCRCTFLFQVECRHTVAIENTLIIC